MDKMSVTKTALKLKERRYFSEDFKREKVQEILTQKITICELSVLYNIAQSIIYRWIQTYSPEKEPRVKIHYEMQSEAQKTMFYKERVAELERLIGTKQIEIEYLNRLIEVASEELSVDIKKNFITKLSNGSEKIQTKEHSK
jgi:transposase-like protein